MYVFLSSTYHLCTCVYRSMHVCIMLVNIRGFMQMRQKALRNTRCTVCLHVHARIFEHTPSSIYIMLSIPIHEHTQKQTSIAEQCSRFLSRRLTMTCEENVTIAPCQQTGCLGMRRARSPRSSLSFSWRNVLRLVQMQ